MLPKMGVSLLIERSHSDPRGPISLEEWKHLVASDDDLRLRTEPYVVVNPRTGDRITVPVGAADAELWCGEKWLPFLRFSPGRLETRFRNDSADPAELAYFAKLAKIAKQLGAVLRNDSGDG
ncbi:MAG TPA: hypothetical protein VHC22_33605 [Pirellulales bacterium]|nr:hypothetical protein [Pirellulales bacterium]